MDHSRSDTASGPLIVARFPRNVSKGELIDALLRTTGVAVALTDFEPQDERAPSILRFAASCNTDANTLLAGSCMLPDGAVAQLSVLEERKKESCWRCTQCGEMLPLRARFCMMW